MSTIKHLLKGVGISSLWVYLMTALCFSVINITNTKILSVLKSRGVMYASTLDAAQNADKTVRFFLVPAKSLIFFVATIALITPLAVCLAQRVKALLRPRDVLRTVCSLSLSLILTATLFPASFGRSYARISTAPFEQEVNQLYRRLLIPGLANLYHLDGFLYAVFFWAIVLLTALTMRLYFLRNGINLSVLQEVSLLTVGIFASSFQVPGYPEIAVLLFGIIALIEFEADGVFTAKQLAAFSLALMAHESCAVIVFMPLFLFLFGRRSWIPSGTVLILYLCMLLANFSFNLSIPLHVQSNISEIPARDFFFRSPSTVFIAAAFAFKALWIVLGAGLFYQMKRDLRLALASASGLAFACASTYLAVDYTRLIGFATIPLILCFREVREKFPSKLLTVVMILNILIPSVYVGGNCGLVFSRGLYYLAYSSLFRVTAPVF